MLLPIHRDRCWTASAPVIVSDPLDALYILRQRLHCCYCSLRAHLPPPTPPSSSYITQARCWDPAASVVVFDPSDASYIPRPSPTSPSSLLSSRACLNLPTPPLLLSKPWAYKHTSVSAVRDVHSGALSLLLPLPTPLLLLSRPQDHLPLPTTPSFSTIPQDCHCNAAAFAVVPEYFAASVVVSNPLDASTLITRASQWKTTYLWVFDLVFILMTGFTCDCWTR